MMCRRFCENRPIKLLFLFLLISACQHGGGEFTRRPRHFDIGRLPRFDLPVEVNERVVAWIDYFTGVDHDRFQRFLDRGDLYVKTMRPILKEEGVPTDLVYLPLIESGFSTHAYSRARASGPWQFIRSTGRHYGLRQNPWVDERRDPEKSTRAAAKYLKKLYRDFDDWYLALAGYNAGEGKVLRAIYSGGTKDYWELTAPGSHHFRPETKDYVPKFLAALMIARMPQRFGFRAPDLDAALTYDMATVDEQTDLKLVAKLTETEEAQIRFLNPELNKSVTPPGSYQVKIPVGRRMSFEVAYQSLPKEEKRARVAYATGHHRVRRGETLGKIARRYGVSVHELMVVNDISNPKRLQAGKFLNISGMEKRNKRRGTRDEGRVTVVASAEDVVKETPSVNTLPPVVTVPSVVTVPPAMVAAEELLTAPAPVPTEENIYVVQSGDTLWDIAQKHNVSIRELKIKNNLQSNRLQPGKKLVLK